MSAINFIDSLSLDSSREPDASRTLRRRNPPLAGRNPFATNSLPANRAAGADAVMMAPLNGALHARAMIAMPAAMVPAAHFVMAWGVGANGCGRGDDPGMLFMMLLNLRARGGRGDRAGSAAS